MSFLYCTNFGSDTDADGVDEFCENKLAESFRPQMISADFDNVDGEPYYAVKEGPNNTIRIMHMLAYYKDLGDCQVTLCSGGHDGDSEFVVMEVKYNAATSHWVFFRMALSQHGSFEWVPVVPLSSVEFPVKDGWYPNVYVADGKHAHYATRGDCDAGAFGAESCSPPSNSWRPEVDSQYNVGSRTAPKPDVPFNEHGNQYTCVESRDYEHRVLFGYDGFECFWGLSVNFAGWQGPHNFEITPYNDYLTQFGF